uniref:Attachment glycoprotein n=2 Tax=Paramyxoviridae sp. TaxID=1663356 RepID=A0A858HS38_9MONO|nr:attachment glycoprotein [Paramyxoviridae sp.]
MSQLAAHNLAMSNFYGTHQGGVNGLQKGEEQPVQGVIRYVSMIVGLLSLFTIIALNVTNIIYMTESGGTMQSIKNVQGSIDGSMKEISGTIMEDIKPKTDLINSMVSYNIPAQLSLIHQIIKNDVLKQCTPSFMFNNTICPLAENPTHSRYFEEVNLDSISECTGDGKHLTLGANPDFIEFPSFAPGSTKPGSCVRLPSFSLSSTVFAYTHTIMGHGCSELDVGDHYLAIGRIADAGHEIPQFETISSWFINDKINRRSCTVAAGVMEAWMGCVIMTETFYDDLDSLDTGKLTISYLDVFGRKKEWIYTRSEIQYDYTYTTAYFSIGSGVVVGDTVYFLIWGSLSSPIEDAAYCFAPGCSNYNQRMCTEAQRPARFGYRQMVNGILRFKTTATGKPVLSVRTLSPAVIPFGTEGRLIYSDITKIIYLYLRSTSWHALPLTGLLILGPPVSISWVTQEAVSRPGEYPCGASNRCPKDCITGVYTDLFPLGARYEYAATVFLNAETYRVNPTLAVINQTSIIGRKKLTTESQKAGYTTTTCFVFKLRIWCVSVVELSPATMTSYEPIPFLYQLDLTCSGRNGSTVMQFSGKDGLYKTGRYKAPRNECFFEKVANKFYFVISTPEGIQPYEIKDLTPDKVPHIIMYISDVCAPAINAFRKILPAMRPITTLTIGNWQFRPVEIGGGLRVNIYRNTTKLGDQSMNAPEDPGSNTFPGDSKDDGKVEQIGHYTVSYPDEWKKTSAPVQIIDHNKIEDTPTSQSKPAVLTTSGEISKNTLVVSEFPFARSTPTAVHDQLKEASGEEGGGTMRDTNPTPVPINDTQISGDYEASGDQHEADFDYNSTVKSSEDYVEPSTKATDNEEASVLPELVNTTKDLATNNREHLHTTQTIIVESESITPSWPIEGEDHNLTLADSPGINTSVSSTEPDQQNEATSLPIREVYNESTSGTIGNTTQQSGEALKTPKIQQQTRTVRSILQDTLSQAWSLLRSVAP